MKYRRYQKKQTTIVGIDYSLNSPAICIADDNFDFNKCSFHFLTSKKKNIGKFGKNIFGYEIKDYNTPIERFNNISIWALDIIHKHKPRHQTAQVFIEGYSFGSKGQAVFQIAENCGLLKYKLHMSPSILYDTIVPSVVKKYASGKGNAVINVDTVLYSSSETFYIFLKGNSGTMDVDSVTLNVGNN